MPGTQDARRRIMDATIELIEDGGLAAASPAAVAERAGAGKMSLYRHFAGKDELIAAALAEREELQRAFLLGPPGTGPARDRLLAIFERLADRADRDPSQITGCPFVITQLALSDPDHPARTAIIAHKDAMRDELSAMLCEVGLDSPMVVAEEILVLLDGAIVHALIRRSGEPFRRARDAAAACLTAASST